MNNKEQLEKLLIKFFNKKISRKELLENLSIKNEYDFNLLLIMNERIDVNIWKEYNYKEKITLINLAEYCFKNNYINELKEVIEEYEKMNYELEYKIYRLKIELYKRIFSMHKNIDNLNILFKSVNKCIELCDDIKERNELINYKKEIERVLKEMKRNELINEYNKKYFKCDILAKI